MNLMLLCTVLNATWVWAGDDLCTNGIETQLEKHIAVPNDVNYFIRADSNREVSFATSDGNRILNIDKATFTNVPGTIDPVISPDGALVATPESVVYDGKQHAYKAMSEFTGKSSPATNYYVNDGVVYESIPTTTTDSNGNTSTSNSNYKVSSKKVEDLKRNGESFATSQMNFFKRTADGGVEKIFSDDSITENYQSLGVLKTSATESRYRMLFEGNEHIQFRDYNYNSESQKIDPVSATQDVCSINKADATPMLSKDGRSFSTYDFSDETTKIYDIEAGGKCRLTDSIPAMVGKVDFSPDGKKLAFHVDQGSLGNSKDLSLEFQKPGTKDKFGIFVYDRKNKRLSAVQDKPDEDSYYPVFLDNDHLAYVSATRGEDSQKFFIDVLSLKNQAGSVCQACSENKEAQQRAAFLGYLYSERCKLGDLTFRSALVGYSRLTPARCHQLIGGFSEDQLNQSKLSAIQGSQSMPAALSPKSSALTVNDEQLPMSGHFSSETLKDLKLKDLDSMCESFVPSAQASPESSH